MVKNKSKYYSLIELVYTKGVHKWNEVTHHKCEDFVSQNVHNRMYRIIQWPYGSSHFLDSEINDILKLKQIPKQAATIKKIKNIIKKQIL